MLTTIKHIINFWWKIPTIGFSSSQNEYQCDGDIEYTSNVVNNNAGIPNGYVIGNKTNPVKSYDKWVILFPGSFNPVHYGHIELAENIVRCYRADELWMMPTPQNPLKNKSSYVNKWDRFIMIEKVVDRFININISSRKLYNRIKPNYFEFTQKAPFYTAKTLKTLKKLYPNYYFTLLIGSDNLAIFDKWKHWKWIYDNVHIVTFIRSSNEDVSELQNKYPKVDFFKPVIFYPISSTQIRNEIRENNYDHVDCSIVDFIKQKKLYQ